MNLFWHLFIMVITFSCRFVNSLRHTNVQSPLSMSLSARVFRETSFSSAATRFSKRNANRGWHGKARKVLSMSYGSMYSGDSKSDTIYALSSGSTGVKTGVAVIRISGPHAKDALTILCDRYGAGPPQIYPKPRFASLRTIYCPNSKEPIDQPLVLWFPGPRSFTGEDVVELHVHGSRAVIKGVFDGLGYLNNNDETIDDIDIGSPVKKIAVRPAERGEFTRRAFDNGKMDLTEVEGLSDLLEADTSEQRKQALRQMNGQLRKQFEAWREELILCLAYTEAVIDFGDDDREGDIDDSVLNALIPRVATLRDELQQQLSGSRSGELIREGVRIVLVGPPNAGKSSLMNALIRRPAAIVSPIAGTTRDVVEVRMDLGGLPCIISDTAGLRDDPSLSIPYKEEEGGVEWGRVIDPVEREGMRRARAAFRQAQLKIVVADASDSGSVMSAEDLMKELASDKGEDNDEDDEDDKDDVDEVDVEDTNITSKDIEPSDILFVLNKVDLMGKSLSTSASRLNCSKSCYTISCNTGEGLNVLEEVLTKRMRALVEGDASPETTAENTMITRARHRHHVTQCVACLDRFLTGRLPPDAGAEELRLAMLELGKVTGRVDVEELLDVIFRDFCIGK